MGINIANLKVKPRPDFKRMLKALKRDGVPDRVPLYELYNNNMERIMGDVIKKSDSENAADFQLKKNIEFQYRCGYDYVGVRADLSKVKGKSSGSADTTSSDFLGSADNFLFAKPGGHKGQTEQGERDYIQAGDCLIGTLEDFEKYEWADLSKVDYSPLDKLQKILPEGMGSYAFGPGGVLSNVMWLMGYEKFSFALVENPELVKAVFDAVGSRLETLIRNYASRKVIGMLVLNDDMGFKTQTLISPDMLREYCFPWHKRIVDAAHASSKPIILHSCGNLKEVYEDIIKCGFDAKHSYEDVIQPAWEFKAGYGKRISVFGGFDMDKISRMTTDEVRKHTRFMLEKCSPDGGFAMGLGNSVADYVPDENFLSMVEETYFFNNK